MLRWATTLVADMIRCKIDADVLPHKRPAKLWAGHGSNRLCAGCDTPIPKSALEYELDDDDEVTSVLHAECYGAWNAELLRRHR
jgi:hypothetical protein